MLTFDFTINGGTPGMVRAASRREAIVMVRETYPVGTIAIGNGR